MIYSQLMEVIEKVPCPKCPLSAEKRYQQPGKNYTVKCECGYVNNGNFQDDHQALLDNMSSIFDPEKKHKE